MLVRVLEQFAHRRNSALAEGGYHPDGQSLDAMLGVGVVLFEAFFEAREYKHRRNGQPGVNQRAQLEDVEERVCELERLSVQVQVGRKKRVHRIGEQLRVGVETRNADSIECRRTEGELPTGY